MVDINDLSTGVFILIKVFPTILIVLDVCAAIAYGLNNDWRHCIYWIAAAVLTVCVTY